MASINTNPLRFFHLFETKGLRPRREKFGRESSEERLVVGLGGRGRERERETDEKSNRKRRETEERERKRELHVQLLFFPIISHIFFCFSLPLSLFL